jgi:hypothetical protein
VRTDEDRDLYASILGAKGVYRGLQGSQNEHFAGFALRGCTAEFRASSDPVSMEIVMFRVFKLFSIVCVTACACFGQHNLSSISCAVDVCIDNIPDSLAAPLSQVDEIHIAF